MKFFSILFNFIKKYLLLSIFFIVIISFANCADDNVFFENSSLEYQKELERSIKKEDTKNAEDIEEADEKLSEKVEKRITKEEILFEFKEKMLIEEIKNNYSHMLKEKIKLIQNGLIKLGYDCGVVDGYVGKNTISAVLEYQFDNNEKLNGILTETDIRNLGITEKMEVIVTLNSIYMEYNNSVGNEWGYEFSVNKTEFKRGSAHKFFVENNGNLIINARVTEYDKISDNGYNSISYTYAELKEKNNFSESIKVIVRENRGRYSGNIALWNLKYNIKISYKLKIK